MFISRWETHNHIHGRTNNPYNTTRIVGGSSGGEGCCQAVGGSVFGIGNNIFTFLVRFFPQLHPRLGMSVTTVKKLCPVLNVGLLSRLNIGTINKQANFSLCMFYTYVIPFSFVYCSTKVRQNNLVIAN